MSGQWLLMAHNITKETSDIWESALSCVESLKSNCAPQLCGCLHGRIKTSVPVPRPLRFLLLFSILCASKSAKDIQFLKTLNSKLQPWPCNSIGIQWGLGFNKSQNTHDASSGMGDINLPVIVSQSLPKMPCVEPQPGKSLGYFGEIHQEADTLIHSFTLVLPPSISPSSKKHLASDCQK